MRSATRLGRPAAFLEANSLTDMAPRTVAVAFHADCPVPRPPWALPWVLKRDGTSGGTEVHFVTDPADVDGWVEAEQELAEQLPFQSVRLSPLPGWGRFRPVALAGLPL